VIAEVDADADAESVGVDGLMVGGSEGAVSGVEGGGVAATLSEGETLAPMEATESALPQPATRAVPATIPAARASRRLLVVVRPCEVPTAAA
jgi:hypothetical protein